MTTENPGKNLTPPPLPATPPPLPPSLGNSSTGYSFTHVSILNPDSFRYPQEKEVLYITLAGLALFIFIFSALTFGLLLLGVVLSIFFLKVRQNNILGGCVAVTEKQFPEVLAIARETARRLGMPCPPVFIQYSPIINAYALGFISSPTVVLHSALVEALSKDELMQVLGHEFSHIKCGHTAWLLITGSAENLSIPILSPILSFIFLFWSRRAEYTCDRGGLICSRNLTHAFGAMGKIAVGKELFERLKMFEFLQQSRQLEENQFSVFAESFSTHPYLVKRLGQLQSFMLSPIYGHLTRQT